MTTLTLKEQEQSISKGKRKQNRPSAKVVLCNPFESFKPLLNPEDSTQIESLLSSILVSENPKPKIPWKKLVKLPKLVRKQKIQECNQQFPISEELSRQRKCLKFGLNAVSRAIRGSKLSSCIIAGDIQSEITRPIITLAVINNKPVIILPKLKELINKLVGFPCSALGIEMTSGDSSYQILNDAVSEMWRKFPLPLNYTNHSKQRDNMELNEVLYNKEHKIPEVKPPDVYLYRTSNNIRIFQPTAVADEVTNMKFNSTLDYISFDVDDYHPYVPPNLKRSIKNTDKSYKKRKT